MSLIFLLRILVEKPFNTSIFSSREEESETSEDIDPSKSAKHGKAKTQRCNTGNGETASGFPSGSKTAKDFGVDSVKCCFPPLEVVEPNLKKFNNLAKFITVNFFG